MEREADGEKLLFPVISSRLVIIRVSLRLLRKTSAISAVRLISSSLSFDVFMATLSTEIYKDTERANWGHYEKLRYWKAGETFTAFGGVGGYIRHYRLPLSSSAHYQIAISVLQPVEWKLSNENILDVTGIENKSRGPFSPALLFLEHMNPQR